MSDNTPLDQYVAARLAAERKRKGLTQAQVAERMGMVRPTVGNIENDKRPVTVAELDRFATVLGVPLAALLPHAPQRPTLAEAAEMFAMAVLRYHPEASEWPVVRMEVDGRTLGEAALNHMPRRSTMAQVVKDLIDDIVDDNGACFHCGGQLNLADCGLPRHVGTGCLGYSHDGQHTPDCSYLAAVELVGPQWRAPTVHPWESD